MKKKQQNLQKLVNKEVVQREMAQKKNVTDAKKIVKAVAGPLTLLEMWFSRLSPKIRKGLPKAAIEDATSRQERLRALRDAWQNVLKGQPAPTGRDMNPEMALTEIKHAATNQRKLDMYITLAE